MLLTGVEKVALNYGTSTETPLDAMSVEDATKYINENQFSSGAMLPKVEAAVSFASSGNGRKSIITSIDTALAGVQGKTGYRDHLLIPLINITGLRLHTADKLSSNFEWDAKKNAIVHNTR